MKKQTRLEKLLGVPEGVELHWWMAEKQYNWPAQIAGNLLYLAIFYFLYQGLAGAFAFVLAMYLHEAGHRFVFRKNGIDAILLLLFPFGAAAMPRTKEEDAKSDLLPWWNIAWLMLAGPIMNFLQVLAGLTLLRFGLLEDFARWVVLINSLLLLFNLLPLKKLDGGQFILTIFSSLDETRDKILAALFIGFSITILGYLLLPTIFLGKLAILRVLFLNLGLLLFLVYFTSGIWKSHSTDNPEYYKSTQAMTANQVSVLIFVYLGLIATTFYLVSSQIPFITNLF